MLNLLLCFNFYLQFHLQGLTNLFVWTYSGHIRISNVSKYLFEQR